MRAEWVSEPRMLLILTAMMPANASAIRVSMATGLRIDDVLSLRPDQLRTQRPTVVERKTGKHRRVYLPSSEVDYLRSHAGRYWVYEGRLDRRKHRTRQAVYKDLRRAATMYRLGGEPVREHVSPHTARKMYAVADLARHGGDLRAVQRDLCHSDPIVTALYAYADRLPPQGRKIERILRGIHTMCSGGGDADE